MTKPTSERQGDEQATVERRELERLQECYVSPEHEEAVAAFLHERPPDFRSLAR